MRWEDWRERREVARKILQDAQWKKREISIRSRRWFQVRLSKSEGEQENDSCCFSWTGTTSNTSFRRSSIAALDLIHVTNTPPPIVVVI
jgi:hypothetical protein